MRRDLVVGFLGAIAASYYVYSNYYKSNTTYRKFDISPIVYKPDILPVNQKAYIVPTEHTEELPKYEAKYQVDINLPNYQDDYSLDTYMELPLETDGRVHDTEHLYRDLEEEESIREPFFVKYLRFQCTETRNKGALSVHVGGFKFFQGVAVASKKPISIWNPHTGNTERYTQEPWADSDQRIVVFRFSEPIIVSHYEIKSSTESPDFDPVRWKLEGSMSGIYWTMMDDRTKSETAFPNERGRVARYIIRS